MSLIPLLFSDWWEDLDRPHRLMNQNFGHGLTADQLPLNNLVILNPSLNKPKASSYIKPWEVRWNERGTSTVQADKDKFQVVLDVQQFEPSEIDVKVVDKCVVVTAMHEEKRDEHGWISRQFVRKYLIPEQCDIDQVTSKLSSDGVLTISVPRKSQQKDENERVIKIEHTGKPAIHQAQPESKAPAKEEK